MTGPRRVLAVVAVAALAGSLGAGCGLSAEKRPHEISDRAIINLVSPASKTPTPSSPGGQRMALCFVQGDTLTTRRVPAGGGPITAGRALTLLLNGPSRSSGLTTSIPPGTTLRSARISGSTLRIDLSGEIKSLGGTAARNAFAQLVFTALAVPGVSSVRFAIDGEDIDAITDEGSMTVIRRSDYKPQRCATT